MIEQQILKWRPLLLNVYASAATLPSTPAPSPTMRTGVMVRGEEPLHVHMEPYPARLPPRWDQVGYRSIFAAQGAALSGQSTDSSMNATQRELSLAHLSVLDATPPQLVTVAAGFRKIGMRISGTPSVGVPPYDMGGATRRCCARRWRDLPIPASRCSTSSES